jgi:PAS domain S-box-containing protein
MNDDTPKSGAENKEKWFFQKPPSPLFSVTILALAIFTVELSIMLVENHFKFLSPFVWDIVDALMLVLVVNPVLYFFIYLPMNHHIKKRDELLAQVLAEKADILKKDELIQLINEITLDVNEAETIENGLNVCLTRICRHVGWQAGHAYRVVHNHEEGAKLVSAGVWYLENSKKFGAFRKASGQASFKAGEGGPGKALESQKPVWIADISTLKDFPVADRIRTEGIAAGIKGCFFFPVLVGKRTTAVLEFFSEKAAEADELLMEVISNLAVQMGRVMERKEAELSVKTLSSAIEKATEAFVLTDPDGIIEYVNPAFERETGFSKPEAVGRNMSILASGKHSESFFADLWKTIKSGGVWSGQITNKKKTGELYEEEMTVSPVEDSSGVITHFIAIKRDVTERKILQNQLIQAEKMFAVGAFVSGVAHELNNPLTAILGFSQRLVAKGGDFPPNVTHQLNIISEQTKRAVKIVQNLLKFSRKTPATTIFCNINEVFENTLSFLEYGLRSDNIEVRKNYVNDPIRVKGDVSQLQQVFTNIILNAEYEMKKSHGSGVLMIHTEISGGEARIEIENDGPPIPKNVMERLFDPFYSTKTIGEGTGLGLYIAYGIVSDHKGKLWAETPGDTGCRFVITLPLVEQETVKALPSAKESAPRAELAGKKILIVEDEEYIRKWLFELFEDNDAVPHGARDGNEALDFINQNRYDLIISDIRMPGKTGYELGQWIYENKPEYRSKFLFITGVIDKDVGGFCEKYGYRFLQKPFGVNELLTTVRDMRENRLR